ncbi:hypothetical protein [Ruania zhangjianzhongii]|uniref:hypothetical protein n=1 Tax=Ruania zhangjianzhongii TaxID=2603206 RepID=UPI0011CCC6DD|nr:hypothetical protein [Ruania zhangjianzhongii]
MRKLGTFVRAAAGIATLVATSTLVGGGIAQADTGPATAETTRTAQAQATTSSDVSAQETFHSWYWDRNECQRVGIDLMHNDPWVMDYRCQYVGLYYRLLVTYAGG